MQTSLIVAALKRLLPIGLNICAPGDQELIALAKNRFSLVRLLFLPVGMITQPPDAHVFGFLRLTALCQYFICIECFIKQFFCTGPRTQTQRLPDIFFGGCFYF